MVEGTPKKSAMFELFDQITIITTLATLGMGFVMFQWPPDVSKW
jgi:hypothetical protein